jgi:NAD(P)-dependent dehydrogenase (short-subunit alcohol dehydrogenase family)
MMRNYGQSLGRIRGGTFRREQDEKMLSMQDKFAVVTGGSGGIGEEIVRAFAEQGCRTLVADIADGARLERELGGAAPFFQCDVADEDLVRSCVDIAMTRFGRIDFVVNCAALQVQDQDQGADTSVTDWRRTFYVNVIGPVLLVRYVRPHLARTHGAVVNVTSISGKVAQAGRWSYPASKAALLQVTRSMALDLSSDGIRVNSVSPGWTWTDGAMAWIHPGRMGSGSCAFPYVRPCGQPSRGRQCRFVSLLGSGELGERRGLGR